MASSHRFLGRTPCRCRNTVHTCSEPSNATIQSGKCVIMHAFNNQDRGEWPSCTTEGLAGVGSHICKGRPRPSWNFSSPIGTFEAFGAQDVTHQGAQSGVWMFLFVHQPPWKDIS
jgi:hypothetical protein